MNIPFDKVYCISYCRNIEKQNSIRKLMQYLNIDFEFIYGADYSNLEILKHDDFRFFGENVKQNFSNDEIFRKRYTHFIGASYDHYTAIINAYESGANSVLILEDDCAFINDLKYIEWAFSNYPEDADIVKFGFYSLERIEEKYRLLSKKFIQNNTDFYYLGSQLYSICNRNTMEKYISIQEKDISCCDYMFNKINCNYYILIDPLCIDIEKHTEYDNYDLLEHIK